jgi:hypothetical protein
VIAIVPTIGIDAKPVTPAPSPAGSGGGTKSFLTALANATSSPSAAGQGTSAKQAPRQESLPSVNGTNRREPRPSDPKMTSSQVRAKTLTQDSETLSDKQSKSLPSALPPSSPLAANWNLATPDVAPDEDASSADSNLSGPNKVDLCAQGSSPLDAALNSTVSPLIDGTTASLGGIGDADPSTPRCDLAVHETAPRKVSDTANAVIGDGTVNSHFDVPVGATSGDSKFDERRPTSFFSPNETGGALADPKALNANGNIPLREAARGGSASPDDRRNPVTPSSAGEQSAIPLSVAPPPLTHAVSAAINADSSQATDRPLKSVADQSTTNRTAGMTQEGPVLHKSMEVIGSTGTQAHKDESSPSTGSQSVDPSSNSAPAKVDATSPFALPGNQPSSSTTDGKGASASPSAKVTDPTGPSDQESNGVAPGQAHLETAGGYPNSAINSAKLIERIGESELRLGIRAGEFGSVDIRTSMVRNELTAEISVERGELGRVMAAELPNLQNRLTDQRVPVAHITVQDNGGGHASEQQKPRDGQHLYATGPVSKRDEPVMPALFSMEGTRTASRLDIHM